MDCEALAWNSILGTCSLRAPMQHRFVHNSNSNNVRQGKVNSESKSPPNNVEKDSQASWFICFACWGRGRDLFWGGSKLSLIFVSLFWLSLLCGGSKKLLDSRTFRTFFLSGNRSTDQSKFWLCSECNTHSGGTYGDIYMHSEAPRCELHQI